MTLKNDILRERKKDAITTSVYQVSWKFRQKEGITCGVDNENK